MGGVRYKTWRIYEMPLTAEKQKGPGVSAGPGA